MKNTVILAVALAGAFAFSASAQAGDVLMSPKAQEQADSLRTVPGMTPDMLNRSIKSASPKVVELRESLRTVPSTGPSIDLASAPRPNLPAKDPSYDVTWRENAMNQSNPQVAPLK